MADILILKGDRPNNRSSAYNTWQALQATDTTNAYFLEEYRNLAFVIKKGEVQCISLATGRDLASYDLVQLRDIGHEFTRYALALYLQHRGRRFINSEGAYFQHRSKLTQYVALALKGIPVPDSLFVAPERQVEAMQRFGFTFPIVAKSIVGSNGADNICAANEEELMKSNIPLPILQSFLPNDFDYRVVVGDNDVLVAYKRHGEGYKNNVAKGGSRELVTNVDPEVADMAVKAARTVRRELAGVDVLRTRDGQHVVLEVNFNFGMAAADDEIGQVYYPKLAAFLQKKAI